MKMTWLLTIAAIAMCCSSTEPSRDRDVAMRLELGPGADLGGLSVKVCRNQVCVVGSLNEQDRTRAGTLLGGNAVTKPRVWAVSLIRPDGGAELTLHWLPPMFESARNRNHYRATVSAASGEVLGWTETASYADVGPGDDLSSGID